MYVLNELHYNTEKTPIKLHSNLQHNISCLSSVQISSEALQREEIQVDLH